LNAEEYYLLNGTIEAFFNLVQKYPSNSKKKINLLSHKTFPSMINNYKADDIFNALAPTIEDGD
jgi:hypothetical protein